MFHSLFLDTYVYVGTIRSLWNLKRRFFCVLNSPSAVRLQLGGMVPLDISTSNPVDVFRKASTAVGPRVKRGLNSPKLVLIVQLFFFQFCSVFFFEINLGPDPSKYWNIITGYRQFDTVINQW